MSNVFGKKSDANRQAELRQILVAKDQKAGERYLREFALDLADNLVKDVLPELFDYRVPAKTIEAINETIGILTRELARAPVPTGHVPPIPFPLVSN